MGTMKDHVSWLGCAVLALACTSAGTDDPGLGSGGTTSTGGAGAAGVAGQVGSNTGGTSSPGGAGGTGAGVGGRAGSGGSPGAGVANGGDSTNGGGLGGAGSSGASNAGRNSNDGGTPSRGGAGGRGGQSGGAAGRGGTAGRGGASGMAGTSSAGAPAAGAGGACVENLDCTLTAAPLSDDIHQDCVDRINQFRTQCACLPALARWTEGEACADQMSEYDAMQNVAHAGFEDKICSSGSGGQNECPGYSSNSQVITLCLQQMWSEGPGPQDPCNGQCFEDHGHYINMTSKSMTKVACGFYTTSSGKVWAAQNFSR